MWLHLYDMKVYSLIFMIPALTKKFYTQPLRQNIIRITYRNRAYESHLEMLRYSYKSLLVLFRPK